MIEKEKEIKEQAKDAVAKKKADEAKQKAMQDKVKAVAEGVKDIQPKKPEPIIAEYGKPTKAVPVHTPPKNPMSAEGA